MAPPGKIANEIDTLSKEGKLILSGCTKEEMASRWREVYGKMSPKQLVDFFCNAIPGTSVEISASIYNSHWGYKYFSLKLHNQALEKEHTLLIFFDPHQQVGALQGLELKSDFHNASIGSYMVIRMVEWLQSRGIKQIRMGTEKIGGYIWPAFGFLPFPEEWQELKSFMNERLEAVKNDISQTTYKTAKSLLESDNAKVLWEIMKLKEKVSVSHLTESRATSSMLQHATGILLTPELSSYVRQEDQQYMALDKALLIGHVWRGSLNTLDSESMKHFNAMKEHISSSYQQTGYSRLQ